MSSSQVPPSWAVDTYPHWIDLSQGIPDDPTVTSTSSTTPLGHPSLQLKTHRLPSLSKRTSTPYIALNGDLAPHPAEYPDAPANCLWFKSYRIATANKVCDNHVASWLSTSAISSQNLQHASLLWIPPKAWWTLTLGNDTMSATYRHGLMGSVSRGPPPVKPGIPDDPTATSTSLITPTWTSIVPVEDPPIGVPQAEDIHGFIALNRDLVPHPAEYPDAPSNRLWFKSYRITATNEA
ncbi:hypothetical protein EDB86DRAFT_2837144 [Lactarius hatsudake]|nr:hypothetical protein EDB86DRAFT_2837144 [Lactarius hatsudake]